MRRLRLHHAFLLALLLAAPACKRREVIHVEPTDESSQFLSSTLTMGDPKTNLQLLRGFHDVEQNAWRWTMGKFAVTLRPPEKGASKGAELLMKFSLPEPIFAKTGAMALTASINSSEVGRQTYTAAGNHEFRAEIPPALLKGEGVAVEFAWNKFVAAGVLDQRELASVVTSISLVQTH